jgi:hypothetical protein
MTSSITLLLIPIPGSAKERTFHKLPR